MPSELKVHAFHQVRMRFDITAGQHTVVVDYPLQPEDDGAGPPPPASAGRFGFLQREHVGARTATPGAVINRLGSGSERYPPRRAPHCTHRGYAALLGARRPGRLGGSPTRACRHQGSALSGLGYAQRNHIDSCFRQRGRGLKITPSGMGTARPWGVKHRGDPEPSSRRRVANPRARRGPPEVPSEVRRAPGKRWVNQSTRAESR